MKKFVFAAAAALAVLALQSAAQAQHGCPGGHCGGHHHCVRAAHVPVEFPLPCLTVPIPKLKVWCACPPCSWGDNSAWYNYWPGANIAPAGSPYIMTMPGSSYGGVSTTPYYWNGR